MRSVCDVEMRSAVGMFDPPEPGVRPQVHRDDQCSQNELYVTGQPFRIEDCREVLSEKISRVSGFAGLCAQPILQRCQRANPSAEFHKGTPYDCRYMEPCEARPFQEQESSEEDKENKAEVEDYEEICAQPVDHYDMVEEMSGWCKRALARIIHDSSSPVRQAQGPEHRRGTKSPSRAARAARGGLRS